MIRRDHRGRSRAADARYAGDCSEVNIDTEQLCSEYNKPHVQYNKNNSGEEKIRCVARLPLPG